MIDVLKEYSESSVAGEGQLKLTIMLYEAAAKFLNQAKDNIKRKEIEEAHNNLTKAKRIVVHFLHTTNPESGELAMNLHRLYIFLFEKIALANVHKSIDEVDAALRILGKLLDGWKELQQKTTPATAPPPDKATVTTLSLQA